MIACHLFDNRMVSWPLALQSKMPETAQEENTLFEDFYPINRDKHPNNFDVGYKNGWISKVLILNSPGTEIKM